MSRRKGPAFAVGDIVRNRTFSGAQRVESVKRTANGAFLYTVGSPCGTGGTETWEERELRLDASGAAGREPNE